MSKGPNNEQLDKWKDTWKTDADTLVLQTFPQKVFEYDELLRDEKFQLTQINSLRVDTNIPIPSVIKSPVEENHNTVPSKKRKIGQQNSDRDIDNVSATNVVGFVNGVSPCNRKIMDLIDIVKPIVREIVENVNKVKMWLLLLIPRIEDGNNFGVAIQEETLSEVRAVESEAAAFLDQISRYFFTRGKLVSRIAKYPHVEDYREAIVDLDEKEFLNLRLVLTEVRNHYTVIHDMIIKNYEKIKKPRTCNTEHLY